MRRIHLGPLFALALWVAPTSALAQTPYPGPSVVATAGNTGVTQLIDPDGTILQTWNGEPRVASAAYLLEDGSIIRPCRDPNNAFGGGAAGGRIQRIDGTDTVVWDYFFSTADYLQHHDVEPMPNGNVLVIAWERVSNADALAAGRVALNGEMWPTLIAEIEPVGATGGNIVWEWRAWDHLVQDADSTKPNYGVISEHPERFDVNFGSVPNGDWIHANCIDYDPVRDLIVFSSRSWNEFYVIDHSTTTAEAAGTTGGARGMGGDILYRWGNPQTYGRGDANDQYYFVIHGANFIDEGAPGAGNVLTFNNGNRPGTADDYSTVEEIALPWNGSGFDLTPGEAFGPAAPAWTYGGPGVFYAGPTQCGAYRVPNGHTRITSRGEDRIFEVTPGGTIVMDYTHPGGVLRATWAEPAGTSAPATGPAAPAWTAAPNPFSERTWISPAAGVAAADGPIEIVSLAGRRITTLSGPGPHFEWDGRDANGRRVAAGVYFARPSGDPARAIRLTVLR